MPTTENGNQEVSRNKKIFLVVIILTCIPAGYVFQHSNYYFGSNNDEEIIQSNKQVTSTTKFPKLINSGTNCFTNSLIQCLFHLDLFRDYIDKRKQKNGSLMLIKNIFDEMRGKPECDLREYYEKLFKNINRHNSGIKKFDPSQTGCSFELFSAIIEELIYYEKNGKKKFQFYELSSEKRRLDEISDLEISNLFLIRRKFGDSLTSITFFLVIDQPHNYDLNLYLKNYYEDIIDGPLPKILVIQNQHRVGNLPVNEIFLQEFIEVGDIKYKFHAYLYRTISNNQSLSHYYACVYKDNKFHILNDVSTNKEEEAVFNVKINGIFGLFYVQV